MLITCSECGANFNTTDYYVCPECEGREKEQKARAKERDKRRKQKWTQ